jgi:hypothetical protein
MHALFPAEVEPNLSNVVAETRTPWSSKLFQRIPRGRKVEQRQWISSVCSVMRSRSASGCCSPNDDAVTIRTEGGGRKEITKTKFAGKLR